MDVHEAPGEQQAVKEYSVLLRFGAYEFPVRVEADDPAAALTKALQLTLQQLGTYLSGGKPHSFDVTELPPSRH